MTSRRQTRHEHQERINAVIHHIHRNLSDALAINDLAAIAHYSPYHFQRISKQISGESVHDYIRRCRLEWAANLLVFNPGSTVMEVAAECGFKSNASFTHAFKGQFGCTPSQWREDGYQRQSQRLKARWQGCGPDAGAFRIEVRRIQPIRVAYMRHIGYDMTIANVWQRLLAWTEKQGLDPTDQQMIGLHHSNPALIPLEQCRYVACLTIPVDLFPRQGGGVMEIPGGLYAECKAEGVFGDLLYLMDRVYHEWLPQSEYEALNIPAHAVYHENHFINESGRFQVNFRVPVRFRL